VDFDVAEECNSGLPNSDFETVVDGAAGAGHTTLDDAQLSGWEIRATESGAHQVGIVRHGSSRAGLGAQSLFIVKGTVVTQSSISLGQLQANEGHTYRISVTVGNYINSSSTNSLGFSGAEIRAVVDI